ncbi:TetR/AcrR family transcriptional regulator [Cytobacillus sp. FSL W7-1323]|uniref:TetR family transcriptional regulator n=1 Tax=Cytobacillus kochii TaxID=859143 RepID=A0A248TGF9_9BACI|nr:MULTISPECIES: TetR/AcrR family transcriptional regulator [Cytobacillus]ASV67287.1 TetR family transcriptional regulator [Cytobacillus kochii]MCA1027965.1 TetR/AcrR family transcriptional regulator [Cytobacillus kochii]MCM3323876.1 TetR/AcrR family transcriptional regulator [Cytobacillus kochii]MCM3346273.1 TetR/AcrR family transcriptional regulator [Cytobacillus kochii]MDM5205869.1 TetR/AcrR family transcriptional regulator [Cytobacillus kochii]
MVVKEDRRVVRTRTNLKSAMLKLLSEKDFKEISITEISKVANCNRVTFYSHYKDSSHLLEDIFQDYLEQLAQYFRDSFKGKKSFLLSDPTRNVPIFEYVQKNQFVFSLMLIGEVIPGSQNHFCETITSISRSELQLKEEVWFDIEAINFYETYALLGLFIFWIKEDFQTTPEEMAQRLSFLHSTSLGEAIVK